MGQGRRPYSPQLRQRLIELVEAGRTPQELAREFEPSAKTIERWYRQARQGKGAGSGEPAKAAAPEEAAPAWAISRATPGRAWIPPWR
ncbi:transposase, partial [Halorhodospira neutriphila]